MEVMTGNFIIRVVHHKGDTFKYNKPVLTSLLIMNPFCLDFAGRNMDFHAGSNLGLSQLRCVS